MSDPEPSAKFSIGAWRDKYGFGQMRVGESVSVEGYNDGNRLRLAAAAYRQNHPEWRYRSERTNVDWDGGKPPGMVVTRIG